MAALDRESLEVAIEQTLRSVYKNDRLKYLDIPATVRAAADEYTAKSAKVPHAAIIIASFHDSCTGKTEWFPSEGHWDRTLHEFVTEAAQ